MPTKTSRRKPPPQQKDAVTVSEIRDLHAIVCEDLVLAAKMERETAHRIAALVTVRVLERGFRRVSRARTALGKVRALVESFRARRSDPGAVQEDSVEHIRWQGREP
jgi:hypothetical protein